MTPVLRVSGVRFVRDRRPVLDIIEPVSAYFDQPIAIERSGGRWSARAS